MPLAEYRTIRPPFLALFAALLMDCFAPVLEGATYYIPVASQLDRGWYNAVGEAAPTNAAFGVGGNYTVGMTGSEVRNFFIFQIPQIAEPIIGAELVLYVTAPEDGGYVSPDGSETLVLYSLDYFSVDVLRRRDTNEANVAVYEDLGDGTPYSSPADFTPTNQNSEVAIPLNDAFLNAVTNRLGASIALGGRLTSIRGYPEVAEFLFAYSHHVPFERTYLLLHTPVVARLEVTANPDSSITLAFPAQYAEYILESTDSLIAADWTPVLERREQIEETIYVTVESTAAPLKIFRLRSTQ